MDEEIERLVVSVRADTSAFARDVASMRGELEGPLVAGAGRAGRMIDGALAKAIMTGKAAAQPFEIVEPRLLIVDSRRGGSVIDAEGRSAIAAILGALRDHGLIET